MGRLASFALVACSATSTIWGATILNTFGPGNTFVSPGVTVGGGIFPRNDPPPNQGATQAWEFAPTFSATVDQIDLAVQYIPNPTGAGGPPDLNVSLFSNAAGQPGVSIETILLTDVNGGSTMAGIASALSTTHPLLTAGTDYWIVVAPPDLLNTAFDWKLSPLSNDGVIGEASRLGNAPWQAFAESGGNAFDITGTVATPEPPTSALGVLGFLAFYLLAYRGLRPHSRPGRS
jgi:hypothetical protein